MSECSFICQTDYIEENKARVSENKQVPKIWSGQLGACVLLIHVPLFTLWIFLFLILLKKEELSVLGYKYRQTLKWIECKHVVHQRGLWYLHL